MGTTNGDSPWWFSSGFDGTRGSRGRPSASSRSTVRAAPPASPLAPAGRFAERLAPVVAAREPRPTHLARLAASPRIEMLRGRPTRLRCRGGLVSQGRVGRGLVPRRRAPRPRIGLGLQPHGCRHPPQPSRRHLPDLPPRTGSLGDRAGRSSRPRRQVSTPTPAALTTAPAGLPTAPAGLTQRAGSLGESHATYRAGRRQPRRRRPTPISAR